VANYEKGANAERRLVAWLRDRGWAAWRIAGSHTPADVVAMKAGERSMLMQCKYGAGSLYAGFPPADRQALVDLALVADAEPWLVRFLPRREPTWVHGSEFP
jgi:Holliday junction resolvase